MAIGGGDLETLVEYSGDTTGSAFTFESADIDRQGEPRSDTQDITANVQIRQKLVTALQARVTSWGISQQRAALRLGIDRSRLNRLLQGRTDRISLEALVICADVAGLRIELSVRDEELSLVDQPSPPRSASPMLPRTRPIGPATCDPDRTSSIEHPGRADVANRIDPPECGVGDASL